MTDEITPEAEALVELCGTARRISDALAERTEDDNAQEWAAELNASLDRVADAFS